MAKIVLVIGMICGFLAIIFFWQGGVFEQDRELRFNFNLPTNFEVFEPTSVRSHTMTDIPLEEEAFWEKSQNKLVFVIYQPRCSKDDLWFLEYAFYEGSVRFYTRKEIVLSSIWCQNFGFVPKLDKGVLIFSQERVEYFVYFLGVVFLVVFVVFASIVLLVPLLG